MIFLLLIVLVVLVVCVMACYELWRKTAAWPAPLRLLLVSFVAALTITPSALVGHGAAVLPVMFVLVDSILSADGHQFLHFVLMPLAVVGTAIYVLLAGVLYILYLIRSI